MIQASIAPLPSITGRVSSWIRLRTRSFDHGALATKCSNDWCLAETRVGAVTAAIGSTRFAWAGNRHPGVDPLAVARQQQAAAIIMQRLRPICMPDHLGQRLEVGRKPFLPVLA